MDAASLDDFNWMVRNGALDVPVRLVIDADNQAPDAGSQVVVRWQAEGDDLGGLELVLPAGQRIRVPAAGRHALEVGGDPVVVSLIAGGAQAHVHIRPRIVVPEVTQLGFDGPLVLEEEGKLRWTVRNADAIRLRVVNGAEVFEHDQLPAQGELSIVPQSLNAIRVELEAASAHVRFSERARVVRAFHTEVRPVIPHVERLSIPDRAVLGESVTLEWQMRDVVGVHIAVGGVLHDGEAVGTLTFIPDQLGRQDITVTARSRHAALSPLAVRVIERRLHVVAPPIEIEVSSRRQTAPIGHEAAFHWTLLGAREARLEAITRRERHDLPLCGSLFVTVGLADETFRLVVTGFDGAVKSETLLVSAEVPDINEDLPELSLLSEPFHEHF